MSDEKRAEYNQKRRMARAHKKVASVDGLKVRKSGRKEAKGARDKLEGLFMHTLLMVRGTS